MPLERDADGPFLRAIYTQGGAPRILRARLAPDLTTPFIIAFDSGGNRRGFMALSEAVTLYTMVDPNDSLDMLFSGEIGKLAKTVKDLIGEGC